MMVRNDLPSKRAKVLSTATERWCGICCAWKPHDSFSGTKTKKSYCNECRRELFRLAQLKQGKRSRWSKVVGDKKECTRCHVLKPFNEFPKCKRGRLGLRPECKECYRRFFQEYSLTHRQILGQRVKARYEAEASACPPWLTSQMIKEIESFYRSCPDEYQVDHIIPLRNKFICGLHVPWNLQYLSAQQNKVKNNRFDFTYENRSWLNG